MLGHQCISLTCTRMTPSEQAQLMQHFLQTPGSIVLTGVGAKRKIGKTFGDIYHAETARKCLRAGPYGGAPTDPRGYDDQPAALQKTLVTTLVKRATGVLASTEIKAGVLAGKNMCVYLPTSPHAYLQSATMAHAILVHRCPFLGNISWYHHHSVDGDAYEGERRAAELTTIAGW